MLRPSKVGNNVIGVKSIVAKMQNLQFCDCLVIKSVYIIDRKSFVSYIHGIILFNLMSEKQQQQ